MLGKNNQQERIRREGHRVTRYGVRKLTIGVASIALSSLWFMVGSHQILADSGQVGVTAEQAIQSRLDELDSAASKKQSEGVAEDTVRLEEVKTEIKEESATDQLVDSSDKVKSGDEIVSAEGALSETGQQTRQKEPKLIQPAANQDNSLATQRSATDRSAESKYDINQWDYTISGDTATITGHIDLDVEKMYVPGAGDFQAQGKTDVKKVIFEHQAISGREEKLKEFYISDNGGQTVKIKKDDLTSLRSTFENFARLTRVDLVGLDTSGVTDMAYMFLHAGSSVIDNVTFNLGANFDTSQVTDMTGMFAFCPVEYLHLGNKFDTGKVTTMASMFSNCPKLKSLYLDEKFKLPNDDDGIEAMFSTVSNSNVLDIHLIRKGLTAKEVRRLGDKAKYRGLFLTDQKPSDIDNLPKKSLRRLFLTLKTRQMKVLNIRK